MNYSKTIMMFLVSINLVNNVYAFPLLQEEKNKELFDAIDTGKLGDVQKAIEHGAQLNVRYEYDKTPLHCAVICNHSHIVKSLLKHGGSVNAQDSLNMTPLHWAAHWGDVQIALRLLRHDARIDIKDHNGRTPLETYRMRSQTPSAAMIAVFTAYNDENCFENLSPMTRRRIRSKKTTITKELLTRLNKFRPLWNYIYDQVLLMGQDTTGYKEGILHHQNIELIAEKIADLSVPDFPIIERRLKCFRAF